jgi:hypothetical protein
MRIRWEEHVARMGEIKNLVKTLNNKKFWEELFAYFP